MKPKILVALDYSETDSLLLEQVIPLARGMGATIILLHVFSFFDELLIQDQRSTDADSASSTIAKAMVSKEWEVIEQTSLTKLNQAVEFLRQTGLTVEGKQVLGHPSSVICSLAASLKVDVIMIGRRGLHGLSEAVLGSVSNYVFHHAPCSVWVVQHPQP